MPGETVSIVNRYGIREDVPAELAQEALALGGIPEAPEEQAARLQAEQYGTLGQGAVGLGEAALRGATVGLSDPLLTGVLGEEYREGAAGRKEELGGLGTAAEVAGAVAPLIASGGTSGLARGASLIGAPSRAVAALGGLAERGVARGLGAVGIEGAGVLGRGAVTGARMAAGGAAEGALYGAGSALSEAALAPDGNYDRLGEKLWSGLRSGAGFGALTGGGIGFVGGAAARAAERGVDKLMGAEGLKSLLTRASEGGVMRTVGVTARDAQRMGEPRISRMAQDLLEHKLDDGARLFKAGDNAEALAGKVQQASNEVGAKLGKMRREVDDYIAATGQKKLGPDMGKFFNRVDEEVMLASQGPSILAKRAETAAEQFAPLRAKWEAGEHITFGEAQTYRETIDSILFPKRATGGIVVAPESQAQLQTMRAGLEEVLESSIERAQKAIGGDATLELYKKTKQKYSSLADASKLMKREAGRDIARNRISPFETLSALGGGIAGVASGSVLPVVAGAAAGAARKLWRERGESVLAVLADRLAKGDHTMQQGVKKFFRRAEASRRGLTGAVAGEQVETRSRADIVLARRGKESSGDAYRRRIREAQMMTTDPIGTLERKIGTRIPTVAPRAAMAMTSAAIRGEQFLIEKAPIGLVDQDALLPHMQPVDPDPVELARFARYVQIVEEPLSVLDELADGTLTLQHTEALRTVYPQMYQQMQETVMNELAEAKEPPPYEERILLGTLLDIPADKSLRPASIAAAQAVYASREERAANPPAPKGGSVGIAKLFSTKVGELEGQEMEM